jgi:hypothetical protein
MFHSFKIPYFTCIFLQDLPTMNILDPIFIACCSTIFASELPEAKPQLVMRRPSWAIGK